MASYKFQVLPGTAGTWPVDTRFIKNGMATLTGNVVYDFNALKDGDSFILVVTQDATAGRTLGLVFDTGMTTVVLGADTAISAVAAKATKVLITRAGNIAYVIYTLQV